jgi:hypothetical protein
VAEAELRWQVSVYSRLGGRVSWLSVCIRELNYRGETRTLGGHGRGQEPRFGMRETWLCTNMIFEVSCIWTKSYPLTIISSPFSVFTSPSMVGGNRSTKIYWTVMSGRKVEVIVICSKVGEQVHRHSFVRARYWGRGSTTQQTIREETHPLAIVDGWKPLQPILTNRPSTASRFSRMSEVILDGGITWDSCALE